IYSSAVAPTLPLKVCAYFDDPNGTLNNVETGTYPEFSANLPAPISSGSLHWEYNGQTFPYTGPTFTRLQPIVNGDSIRLVHTPNCIPSFSLYSNTLYPTTNTTTSSSVSITAVSNPFCEGSVLLPIWQRATLVSLSGNQVTHATYNNSDAGVSSYQKLPDGYRVESTVAETNTRRILGLSEVDANAQWSSIKYGILLTQLGNLEIRQSGSGNLIGTRTYATGDVIAIAHEGTQVKYYHNGVLIYTSLVPAPQPLLIDIWTTSVNATLQNVVIRRGMGVDVGPIRSFQATAVNGGSNPLFSWSLNGIPLPSTSNALSLQGLKNGDEIRCNLIPFEPCILGSQSAPITLALGSPANIALAAIPTICEGDTALLQILPGADSIVWPVQTGILPFSTDSAWLFADTNTTFPILAISPNGCATTVQAVHTVNPSLTPNGLSISPSIPHWCTYPQQQSVTWTTLSGWSQNAAQITSTGVGTQFRCAFAHQGIRSGNYVKTTILETNKVRSIGISDHWVPCTNETMAYEFALLANGTCQIKEKGINQGAAFGYLTGDVLELKLFANQLQYLRNGIVLRAAPLTANKLWYIAGKTQVASATLNQVVTGQFVVLNGSIAQQGQLLQMSWLHNGDSLGIHTQSIEYYDTLNNQDSIQFLGEGCGTALSPPFVIQTSDTSHTQVGITTIAAYNCNPKFFHLDYRNLVAVTQQGDDLYGTSYYSWGTSGFSSVQAIGDGYGLQFTAGAVQGTRLLGLSQVDADQNWTTIQYAWFLQSNGTLGIMESGVTMPYGSTYNGVDTLRILYQGGQMKYYKNSTLAYSHAVPTGMRLHADAAFSSYGRFYDVVFYRPSGAGYQGSTRLVASYSPAHVDSSFQWYCNGLQVPNELDDTLTLHSFLEGDYVFVLARPTDQCGIQAQSATVIGHVPNANPSISASPPSACGNDPIMLNGVGSAYFIWNGGSLVGVQGPSVTTTIGSSTYFIGSLSGNAGCNWSGNVYVTFRPPAVPNLGPDRTICSNSQLLNPGSGFQSYLWQNGSTTSTLVATSPGVYSVRVTNGFGCVGRDTVTLGFASLNLGPNRTVCAGQSVTLQPTNPWASYAWSNGANTASITVSNPGTYILAATHASGCVSRDTVVVTHHPSPAPPIISASGPIAFCQGGSVTLTSSPASSYVWSNGSTSQSISVSNSGNYTVTISDANGCEANSNAFAVTVNPLPISPTIVANGSPTICSGDSVTMTSSPANSYAWSNGATSQSISVSNSGNYSVTISDVNGCMAASTGFVVSAHPAPSPPIISASGPIAFCQGDSVTLTSSQANSYVWSNGATSQSISVSNSGNYSVTISDANGCEANSNAFAVTVNPLPISPTIVANGSPVICTGDSVTLTSSHAASYSWSNGATSQSISVSNSGNYSVTISDVNGCEANSNAFAVTVNPLPISPTIAANGSPSICPGDSVTLTSSPASSYVWSNGATSQSISVFAAGTFAVTITDANGCLANSNGFAVTVSSGPAQPSITPNGSQNLCQGDTVTLISSPAAAYLWSNGAVTQSINVIAAGTYSVTTSAMNGCSAVSLGFVVSVNALPPSPTITPNGPTTFCQGDSVILNASPATSYLWSNGATSQAIAVFSGGVYTVTIFDANGCASSSIGVTVNVSPLPFPPIVVFDGLTLSTQAATTYQWYLNGLPISGANDSTFVPTQSGSYFVVVTDSNGCSIQSNVEFVNLLGSQSHWIAGHRVVPNPSVGKFKVLMEQVPLDAELRIYDVLGQMVYRSDNVTAQFDLSHLSKGSYFLQLIAPDVLWGTVLLLQ
ncbi:MAG: T9SS type A sorting domain-containing protein, partial [Bacteroidetes bacterium]|nr:T9SS type A sorting domain-containing protein [Bacteroidota bacterium]